MASTALQPDLSPADGGSAGADGGKRNSVAPALPELDDPGGTTAHRSFVERVPISFARRHLLLGIHQHDGGLGVVVGREVATRTHTWDAVDAVRRWIAEDFEVFVADDNAVLAGINRGYESRVGHADQAIGAIADHGTGKTGEVLRDGLNADDLLDGEGRAPVIQVVNALLFEAVKMRASDVHVQPREGRVVARMRVDGILFDAFTLPATICEELVSRIKVMGQMNIAEKRLPQDGRATVRVGDRVVDMRISTVPTSFGERVVFRLLDKSARLYSLEDLGMPPDTLAAFSDVIRAEHGLVLVTGPTGSGKSTTLYGALQRIDATELNVLTLEDPIEYQLPGISQMQVSEKKGMTFARGLRSVLRQDPDIIMVGEIRDRETAELAIQAALTGHLVFSTLHTNDSASAVTRLLDLGVEPYLVASSLLGVMAQRLVRRVCSGCAAPLPDDTENQAHLRRLGVSAEQAQKLLGTSDHHHGTGRRGTGCDRCRDTGYHGRVGLFELLAVDERMYGPIEKQAPAATLKQIAVDAGMRTLRNDGTQKMLEGLTTPQEVLRVTFRAKAAARSTADPATPPGGEA